MKNHYKSYLTTEIEKAEKLFFKGVIYKEIAVEMGRTETAIKELFKSLGLRRYKSPTDSNYTKAKL